MEKQTKVRKKCDIAFVRCFLFLSLLCSSGSVFAGILYVSNSSGGSSGTITAYDTSSGNPTGPTFSTAGLNDPYGVCLNPEGTILYVVNSFGSGSGSGTITAYDTSSGAPTGPMFSTMGLSDPRGICLNPEGTILYVANLTGSSSGTITAYDTSSGAPTGPTFSTTGLASPVGICLNPEGTILYVANNAGGIGNGSITSYDTSSGAELVSPTFSMAGLASPLGICLNPEGTILYVANSPSGGTITAYNTSSGAPTGPTFSTTGLNVPFGICLNPEGTILYVVNNTGGGSGNGSITSYDTSSGAELVSPTFSTTGLAYPTFLAVFFPSSGVRGVTGLTGNQRKNNFGLQIERYNSLSWEASASQVLGYYVYRDGEKIATLGSNTLSYEDHNRPKGESTVYSVTAYNVGGESLPMSITIQ